jgi:hypothetical protein
LVGSPASSLDGSDNGSRNKIATEREKGRQEG